MDRKLIADRIKQLEGQILKLRQLLQAMDDPEIASLLSDGVEKPTRKRRKGKGGQREQIAKLISDRSQALTVKEIAQATGLQDPAIRSIFSQNPGVFSKYVGDDGLTRWTVAQKAA